MTIPSITEEELKEIERQCELGPTAPCIPHLVRSVRQLRAALAEQHRQHQAEAKALLLRAEEATLLAQLAGDRAQADQQRVAAAIEVAVQYGNIDGAHHRKWVIDQMLRALLGQEGYAAWLERENQQRVAEGYDPWDPGVPP